MPVAPAMLGTHQALLGIGQAKQMNLLPPKLISDAFKTHRRARASVRGFALLMREINFRYSQAAIWGRAQGPTEFNL